MSKKATNWLDCHSQICRSLKQSLPEKQAKQTISEMESVLIRKVLPAMGFTEEIPVKLTKRIKELAFQFMATLPITKLKKGRRILEKVIREDLSISQASRYTYGARGHTWFDLAALEAGWAAEPMSAEFAAQCAPITLHGHQTITDVRITNRRGEYTKYALDEAEMNSALKACYDAAIIFYTRPNQPGRPFPAIGNYAIKIYKRGWRQVLGYQVHYNGVSLEELGPQHIFPIMELDPDDFEDLLPKQQKKLWKQQQRQLEEIICGFRDFQVQQRKAHSPHTWHSALVHIGAFGRFLYADWVEVEEDYKQLPVFKTLTIAHAAIQEPIKERQKSPDVAGLAAKWPVVPKGSTALEVFQQDVLGPMRLECLPRTYSRALKSKQRIAHLYQQYNRVALMGLMPPLRQQVDRSLRCALSCPIQRPDDVPVDGLYYPRPPEEIRARDQAGRLADNYVYKVYTLNGHSYPEGIWVREVQQQKTRKSLGVHQTIIPNRRFADGSNWYHYLEDYLQGIWQPQSWDSSPYQWTDARFIGTDGNWVSAGRSECNPQDEEALDANKVAWRTGFLFVSTDRGLPYCEHSYHECIRTNANRLIGKAVTPHTMRYIWATWGFQVGLSDTELQSLAYMMSHSVDTLRRMYMKVTPEEYQRPIEEAINARLCQPDAQDALPLHRIIRATFHLTRDEQKQLLIHLKRLLDSDDDGATGVLQSA
jgi:hypothetical protein